MVKGVIDVGASLLAIAFAQTTSAATDAPPSRASSLPQVMSRPGRRIRRRSRRHRRTMSCHHCSRCR
ncbi:hypothetical protein DLD99_25055 [Pseudomonas kribbensis]|uniref:Secreted protein n=1 Tax=Pseudomonas kribbensis TaxID=1628086 RepID=A0A345RWD8_9PSED|nr:hypothetical protein DLD99_25055 [Pseudomonas kribbensis]